MQPYLDNKEDQDGSEASVLVKSLLSLYPVISIDHNFAEDQIEASVREIRLH